MAKELRLLLGATLLLLLAATAPAVADDVVVRILFFTGDVTVKSGGSASAARIGQAVGKKDVIILKGNATLQLSVNGKVLKYNKPAQLKVADAIKRAGKGENEAVANSLRTLAAASGAGRNSRHSEAGATRAAPPTDSSRLLDDARRKGMETVKNEANSEVGKQLGIDDPLGKATGLMDYLRGDKLIVLELSPDSNQQRASNVPLASHAGGDKLLHHSAELLGAELFKTSVSDTQAVWPTPSLQPEAVYTDPSERGEPSESLHLLLSSKSARRKMPSFTQGSKPAERAWPNRGPRNHDDAWQRCTPTLMLRPSRTLLHHVGNQSTGTPAGLAGNGTRTVSVQHCHAGGRCCHYLPIARQHPRNQPPIAQPAATR